MLKKHLEAHGPKIDNEKIKQKISEQLTEDLIGKLSYKNENVKLKVTYELECNSFSGEVKFGNLLDVIDIQTCKTTEDIQNDESQVLIDAYLKNGNFLKPKQIECLIMNDFNEIGLLFKNNPLAAKKLLRNIPTIGRVTYRALCEFLSNESS